MPEIPLVKPEEKGQEELRNQEDVLLQPEGEHVVAESPEAVQQDAAAAEERDMAAAQEVLAELKSDENQEGVTEVPSGPEAEAEWKSFHNLMVDMRKSELTQHLDEYYDDPFIREILKNERLENGKTIGEVLHDKEALGGVAAKGAAVAGASGAYALGFTAAKILGISTGKVLGAMALGSVGGVAIGGAVFVGALAFSMAPVFAKAEKKLREIAKKRLAELPDPRKAEKASVTQSKETMEGERIEE